MKTFCLLSICCSTLALAACGDSPQPSFCSDGVVDGEEVCDDGNATSGDGCSSDCQSVETCGNGVVDVAMGETCDDGNNADDDGCNANCELLTCSIGQLYCGGACVDPDTDEAYCGATADCEGDNVGVLCDAGEACNTGLCELSCQTGLTDCSGTCVDTDLDRDNCGGCGDTFACTDGQICDGAGSCEATCASGLSDCSGTCTDLTNNVNRCGTCDNQCEAGADQVAYCALSSCETCTLAPIADQTQDVYAQAANLTDHWQSITAGAAGKMAQIGVFNANSSTPLSFTMTVYAGHGTGGALLSTHALTMSSGTGWKTLPLLESTLTAMEAGQQYTLHFSGGPRLGYITGNPYAGGSASWAAASDLMFVTYLLSGCN